MVIKGLTDNTALSLITRQLPRAGKFKKGDPKPENGNRPGQDRSDGTWRVEFDEGMEYVAEVFHRVIPDTSQPIIIATLGNTVQDCLDDFYRLYGANHIAKRLCDGEHIKYPKSEADNPCLGCPLKLQEAKDSGKKVGKDVCKPMGYFRFTIPLLTKVLRHEVSFQFDITSVNELQQFAKELEVTLLERGRLVNQLFVLRRNPRVFARDGYANEKSLAYLSSFDFDLLEKAATSQQRLAETNTPQLPAAPKSDAQAVVDGEINDSESSQAREQQTFESYSETVSKWITHYLGEEIESFLFQYGTFASMEALYEKVPDLEQLKSGFLQYVVNNNVQVRFYGVRTMQWRNRQRMAVSFEFGYLYLYTRTAFGKHLEEKAKSAYTDSEGNVRNLTQIGDHAFKDVFDLDFLSMTLKFTEPKPSGDPNIEAVDITDDIPF